MKIYRKAQSDIYDMYDLVLEERGKLVEEYNTPSRQEGTNMSWSVIPFNQLKKIWEDYVTYGVVHNTRGLDTIVEKILRNLARLQASTELAGHTSGPSAEETFEEHGYEPVDGKNIDFYFDFLNTEFGAPVSDYGLDPLWKLAEQLMSAQTYEEKLVLVDQMLNVVHQRGDLAALFIEGGSYSLSELSEA